MAACEWDATCIGIVRDCTSNKKCYDQANDKMDWSCMTLCVGPKKNALANKVAFGVCSLLCAGRPTVPMPLAGGFRL